MLPERDRLYLRDMLYYANQALDFVNDKTLEDLTKDIRTQLALERCIEIIGEAAKTVSAETKDKMPGIPWQDIARTRDFFAHHYFKIDLNIMWQIVSHDLPALVGQLEQLIE